MTISAFSDELAQVRTKKKEFLSQIERIVPWKEWFAMIQPCYYKGERGNKPYPLEIMLRLYLLQNLYDLSDEATVAEAIDSRAFSEFCGVDSSNQVPDGDTLGRFRNLLIKNGLQEKLFAQVVAALMERGLILKKGTIVDSTIISAPSSTKNKEKERDPDAHQVKKGNTWHFGYKAHIGVDKDSGLVHTVKATPANVHDVAEVPKLLTGEEETVYGDSGYLGAGKREDAVVRNKAGRKIKYKINRRPSQMKKLSKSGQYAAKKAERKRNGRNLQGKADIKGKGGRSCASPLVLRCFGRRGVPLHLSGLSLSVPAACGCHEIDHLKASPLPDNRITNHRIFVKKYSWFGNHWELPGSSLRMHRERAPERAVVSLLKVRVKVVWAGALRIRP